MALKTTLAFCVTAAIAAAGSTAQAEDTGWKPTSNVEFVVGAGPGGENDRIARAIQRILEERGLVPSMTVTNKPGAGQTIAHTYLASKEGDPNIIGLASGSFIAAIARSGSTLHQQLTPLLKLFAAYQIYFAKTGGPIKSMADVKERLAADPQSVTFSFPVGLGSPLHISAANVAKAAGVSPNEIKTVVFDSGTDVAAQVAGGHVDVGITSIGSAMPLTQAGEITMIGIASPERLDGIMADVPTLREQGLDVITANPYTVLAPGGLTDEQIAFWVDALQTVVHDPEFQKDLDKNFWVLDPVPYPEAAKFVQTEYDALREVLIELGFAQ